MKIIIILLTGFPRSSEYRAASQIGYLSGHYTDQDTEGCTDLPNAEMGREGYLCTGLTLTSS